MNRLMFVPLGCKSQCFNVGIHIFGFSHFVLKLHVKYGTLVLPIRDRIRPSATSSGFYPTTVVVVIELVNMATPLEKSVIGRIDTTLGLLSPRPIVATKYQGSLVGVFPTLSPPCSWPYGVAPVR